MRCFAQLCVCSKAAVIFLTGFLTLMTHGSLTLSPHGYLTLLSLVIVHTLVLRSRAFMSAYVMRAYVMSAYVMRAYVMSAYVTRAYVIERYFCKFTSVNDIFAMTYSKFPNQ